MADDAHHEHYDHHRPWKVDETGMNNHEGLTFQILDGQRKIVWPKKISEVPYKLPMPKWKDRAKN